LNWAGKVKEIKFIVILFLMVATKIKIAETIIFPIVTYGTESWTGKKLTSLSCGCGEKCYEYYGQREE
jgi:hypothetical protein